MESRGYIRRLFDPNDRRITLVELTDEGLAKIDAAPLDHAANEAKILAALDADEYQTLVDLLPPPSSRRGSRRAETDRRD